MTATEKKQYSIDRLLAFLQANSENRGIMADLRRGFSHGTEDRAWPHLAQFCRLEYDRERIIMATICAGFATVKGTQGQLGMGAVLRRIALDSGANEALKSFEGRFRRLLTCDSPEEVCSRLPAIFRLAEKRGIGIDFQQLYWDLKKWDAEGSRVKVKWADDYWGATREKQEHADNGGES